MEHDIVTQEGTEAVILAGGKGTRMKSDRPKVLTEFCGAPIILRLLAVVTRIFPRPTIVVGYRADEVMRALGDQYRYVLQKEQLGTGHALAVTRQALDHPDVKRVLVLNGDHPLVSTRTIREILAHAAASQAAVTMATIRVKDFTGDWSIFERFGHVIRGKDGAVERVVEWKDATEDERAVSEVNPNYYCFDASWLWKNITKLEQANAAQEYYLTDLVGIARDSGERIEAFAIENPAEGMGVNTAEELRIAEKYAGQ